jgi:hypothetical protein
VTGEPRGSVPEGQRRRWPPRRGREWLAVAGVALALAAILPPVASYARQYAFVQALQFTVFAVAAPALLAVSRPARPTGGGLPGAAGLLGVAGRLPRPAGRRAPRAGQADGTTAAIWLVPFLALAVGWRLPAALDAVER